MARPTLLNLETALWVDRIGSFSGAARKMNATQPAIALRIRELEGSLNFRIFVRHGQQMLPTPKGREFLERIEPLVRELQVALGEANPNMSTMVRVGAGHLALTWLSHVLDSLVHRAANIRYEITVERVPTLVQLIEKGKIDLGLLPTPLEHPELECVLVGQEPSVWVMATNRVQRFLAYSKQIDHSIEDVLNHGPVWLPHKTSPHFQKQTELMRSKGANLRNIHACNDILRVVDLIACTGGLGNVPRSLVSSRIQEGELQIVRGLPESETSIFAIRRRSDRRAILDSLTELVRAQSPSLTAGQGSAVKTQA